MSEERPQGSEQSQSRSRERPASIAEANQQAERERRDGNPLQRAAHAADDAQARTPVLAFPLAVVKKFGDDNAGNLAALIAYYGFFSIFPLLLALTTVVGFLFHNDKQIRDTIKNSALQQFPVIGAQLQTESLHGSWFALAVGLVGAIWAGLGVVNAAQNAMNAVWDVPQVNRPNFIKRTLRGLVMLAVGGALIVVSGYLAGIGQGQPGFSATQIVSILGAFIVNVLLFASAFRILTIEDVSWRDVAPGALVAAVAWTILLLVGQWFVSSRIHGAKSVYGTFAIVLGLLSWLYLASQITLYASEINVVLKKRLWPRSITVPPVRQADERSYALQAEEQEFIRPEDVHVDYGEAGGRQAG